jgi:hypothetical protein
MTWNRSFARTAWVLPAALAVHVAEEAPGFAAWARRNAWTGYTQRDFRRINAAGLALTTVGTWLVARTCRRAPFLAWHTTVLSQQALWNPVFHAGTTVAYREYSPGLVTALALFPATWVALTAAAVREGRISRRAAALSALGGAAVHAAAVTQQVYGVRAADGGGPRRRRWPLVATGDTTAAGDGIHRRWARSPSSPRSRFRGRSPCSIRRMAARRPARRRRPRDA